MPDKQQETSVTNKKNTKVRERLQYGYLPIEILNHSPIVWLGTDSNDTIPIFARSLRNQITFIDTAIDCTEYITSLSALRHSIILIMSDEYTVHRKGIEDMLSLYEIKMIYVIGNEFQLNPIARSLQNPRLKYIFSDTSRVLRKLCLDRDEWLAHRDVPMLTDNQCTEIRSSNIPAEKDEESIRMKPSSPRYSKQKLIKKAQISMDAKIEQTSSNSKVPSGIHRSGAGTKNKIIMDQGNESSTMITSQTDYYIKQGILCGQQAVKEDMGQNYGVAAHHYTVAADWLMRSLKGNVMNVQIKQTIRSKIESYLERAEELNEAFENNSDQRIHMRTDGRRPMIHRIPTKPQVSFNDIVGLKQVKDLLTEAVILPVKIPQIFIGKRRPWSGILLYGPSGTGKSYLVQAVATESKSTLITISPNDLLSKRSRESKEIVKSLFDLARQRQPCILFIDHIDALCSRHNDTESELLCAKHEFFVQMEGVKNDNSAVFILAATHLPWELDAATRKRFEKCIYIPLPDLEERALLFKMYLSRNTFHIIQEHQWIQLAQRTERYSGADIDVVCREASLRSLQRIVVATHFKKVPNPKVDGPRRLWLPCSFNDPQAEPLTLDKIQSEELCELPVTLADIQASIAIQKPTVSAYDVSAHDVFARRNFI